MAIREIHTSSHRDASWPKHHAINPASDNGAVLNTGYRSRSPIRGLGRAVASRELDHLVCYAPLENGCSVDTSPDT